MSSCTSAKENVELGSLTFLMSLVHSYNVQETLDDCNHLKHETKRDPTTDQPTQLVLLSEEKGGLQQNITSNGVVDTIEKGHGGLPLSVFALLPSRQVGGLNPSPYVPRRMPHCPTSSCHPTRRHINTTDCKPRTAVSATTSEVVEGTAHEDVQEPNNRVVTSATTQEHCNESILIMIPPTDNKKQQEGSDFVGRWLDKLYCRRIAGTPPLVDPVIAVPHHHQQRPPSGKNNHIGTLLQLQQFSTTATTTRHPRPSNSDGDPPGAILPSSLDECVQKAVGGSLPSRHCNSPARHFSSRFDQRGGEGQQAIGDSIRQQYSLLKLRDSSVESGRGVAQPRGYVTKVLNAVLS